MPVNLFLLPILAEEAAEDTQSAHPQYFRWHPGLASASALACTGVAALAFCVQVLAHARPRVHLDRFAIDEAVLDELPDVETRIRHRDFARLIGIQPECSKHA